MSQAKISLEAAPIGPAVIEPSLASLLNLYDIAKNTREFIREMNLQPFAAGWLYYPEAFTVI
jgi:hypothetical protein